MRLSLTRRWIFTALLLAAPNLAVADTDYPKRLVKIVVPAPAGTVLDSLPRILADKLAARWGQAVVIENRPGAAQNLGAEVVAKSEPDGYTLLATPDGPLVISQHLFRKLGFDPGAFVPVTLLVKVLPVVVTNPKVPAKNIGEFIA